MLAWKDNWQETQERFTNWWDRKGVIIGSWNPPVSDGPAHEKTSRPKSPPEGSTLYTLPELRAEWNHYWLSRSAFPYEVLPIADTDLGPGSTCLFLGCTPRFSPATVWFDPCWHELEDVEETPELVFDPANPWWQLTEATLKASVKLARGKYLVGCPDLVENVDVLSSLRDPQNLMVDLLEAPEWVEGKIRQITDAWIEAYQRIYDIIKLEDGSSAFGAFRLWAPGKVAKLQCDASAMFSPGMYRRFVLPELTRQCDWLDYSMYHLDGTQAICHLDALLEIESLDAIEWTPQSGIESGGNERWYPMYRKILEAGKSIQVVNVRPEEINPLLNAVGRNGVYIMQEYLDYSGPTL